jgi:hypothetical protein
MTNDNAPRTQAILQAEEYVSLLRQVLDMNEQILKQNSLIVQSVTMPQLLVKAGSVRPGEWVEI